VGQSRRGTTDNKGEQNLLDVDSRAEDLVDALILVADRGEAGRPMAAGHLDTPMDANLGCENEKSPDLGRMKCAKNLDFAQELVVVLVLSVR